MASSAGGTVRPSILAVWAVSRTLLLTVFSIYAGCRTAIRHAWMGDRAPPYWPAYEAPPPPWEPPPPDPVEVARRAVIDQAYAQHNEWLVNAWRGADR